MIIKGEYAVTKAELEALKKLPSRTVVLRVAGASRLHLKPREHALYIDFCEYPLTVCAKPIDEFPCLVAARDSVFFETDTGTVAFDVRGPEPIEAFVNIKEAT